MNIPDFLSGWKIGGVALAILASGATIGAAISNKKLEQHQIQTDSLLVEVRAQRRILDTQLCIQVAQLRRTDWTDCILK